MQAVPSIRMCLARLSLPIALVIILSLHSESCFADEVTVRWLQFKDDNATVWQDRGTRTYTVKETVRTSAATTTFGTCVAIDESNGQITSLKQVLDKTPPNESPDESSAFALAMQLLRSFRLKDHSATYRVAVLPIDAGEGVDSPQPLLKGIRSRLEVLLGQTGVFTIIERDSLDLLIKERKLEVDGWFTEQEQPQLEDIDLLLVSSCFFRRLGPNETWTRINTRLVAKDLAVMATASIAVDGPASLTADAQRSISLAAAELSRRTAATDGISKVAVVGVKGGAGIDNVTREWLAEELVTALHNKGVYTITERRAIKSVIGELKLDKEGWTAANAANASTRMKNVDAVIVGTIDELPQGMSLTTKLIARNAKVLTLDTKDLGGLAAKGIVRPAIWKTKPNAWTPGAKLPGNWNISPAFGLKQVGNQWYLEALSGGVPHTLSIPDLTIGGDFSIEVKIGYTSPGHRVQLVLKGPKGDLPFYVMKRSQVFEVQLVDAQSKAEMNPNQLGYKWTQQINQCTLRVSRTSNEVTLTVNGMQGPPVRKIANVPDLNFDQLEIEVSGGHPSSMTHIYGIEIR